MKQLENSIDKLILSNHPFVLWRKPYSLDVEMIIANVSGISIIKNEHELIDKEGFIFAPFQASKSSPLVLIQGEHLKSEHEILNLDLNIFKPIITNKHIHNKPFIISQNEYHNDINKTIECIKNEKFSKVIISRIIQKTRKKESLGRIFNNLQEKNNNAFVYLVSLPNIGLWIGATPELLIDASNNTIKTVSLAGTQLKKNNNEEYSWRTKEIEEQAFVSRYILDTFNDFNIKPYTTKGPETLIAGNIAHLKTTFSFSAENITEKLQQLITQLHPTPAVCGLPKAQSMQYIHKVEKHKRKYYTGYLGPWRMNNKVELYVNLRCMEVTHNNFLIYVGGGITSQSDAKEEWEETERKANTMLSAL